MNQQLQLKKYRNLVQDVNRQIFFGIKPPLVGGSPKEQANITMDLIFTDKEVLTDSYIKILRNDVDVKFYQPIGMGFFEKDLSDWFNKYSIGRITYGDMSVARKLIDRLDRLDRLDGHRCSEALRYQIIFWWLMAVTSSQLEREVKSQKISLICDFAAAFKITETEMEDIINALKFVYKESSTLTFQSKEVEGVFSELKGLYY